MHRASPVPPVCLCGVMLNLNTGVTSPLPIGLLDVICCPDNNGPSMILLLGSVMHRNAWSFICWCSLKAFYLGAGTILSSPFFVKGLVDMALPVGTIQS